MAPDRLVYATIEGRIYSPGGTIYTDGNWVVEHALPPINHLFVFTDLGSIQFNRHPARVAQQLQ